MLKEFLMSMLDAFDMVFNKQNSMYHALWVGLRVPKDGSLFISNSSVTRIVSTGNLTALHKTKTCMGNPSPPNMVCIAVTRRVPFGANKLQVMIQKCNNNLMLTAYHNGELFSSVEYISHEQLRGLLDGHALLRLSDSSELNIFVSVE